MFVIHYTDFNFKGKIICQVEIEMSKLNKMGIKGLKPGGSTGVIPPFSAKGGEYKHEPFLSLGVT